MKKICRIISRCNIIAATVFYLLVVRWFDRCRKRRQKVLIVTPLRLGDFAMFLPVLPDLTEYFLRKNLQVTLLTTPALLPLVRQLERVEIIAHPYPENAVSFSAAYRLYRRLTGERFQVAVAAVTERSFFHDDLPVLYSGAKEVYLPQAVRLPEKFWWRLPFLMDKSFFRRTIALPEYVKRPEMENYARLTAAITGEFPRYRKIALPVSEKALFAPGYILFAPGSQDISRCCDMTTAGEAVKYLCRTHQVVIAGSAAEFERAEILRDCGGDNCINFCGKSDLPALLRLIADAAMVVGTDSGIANLAILSGKKAAVAVGWAHDRFMFVPAAARDSGFSVPQICRTPESCLHRNCNWNCRFSAAGKTYPCLQITAAEFIDVIARSMEK